MSEFEFVDLMFISATFALWVAIAFLIKSMLRNPKDEVNDELKRLREENRRLTEEVERVRQHYELLLKDAAVKNAIMVSLYNAWKSGELKRCYEQGGELRILADGTLLCSKKKVEDSYRIKVEEVEGLEPSE